MTISLDGKTLTVIHLEEGQQAVQVAWDSWQNSAYVKKYKTYGSVRSWILQCLENGVPWASSQAKSFQDTMNAGNTVNFAISDQIRVVNTNVYINGVQLDFQDIAANNIRGFTVQIVESSLTGGGGGGGGDGATLAYGEFTIPAGNTSVAVNHSLGSIPTAVVVSPVTDCAGKRWSITSRTSTQFVVDIDSSCSFDITFDYVCA